LESQLWGFPYLSRGDFPSSQLIVDRIPVLTRSQNTEGLGQWRVEVVLKTSDVEMLQLELEAESVKFLSEITA